MAGSDFHKELFKKEIQVLETAMTDIKDEKYRDNELLPNYRELANGYNELLKLAGKVFRISDMQGNELKKTNDKLEQANEKLRLMERSRRELFSNISHELGTPMQSIQGYVQAMLQGMIEVDNKKYLQIIYDKIRVVDRLIQDMFELSKLEAGQVEFLYRRTDVCRFLEEVYAKLEFDIAQKGIRFELETIRNVPAGVSVIASMDPIRIEQVISNIVFNAVKFTPEGGSIRIHGELMNGGGHAAADSKDSCDLKNAVIKVTDTGEGVSEDLLPYIFDRFVKGDKSRNSKIGGAGLGLSISKEIVKFHNGAIGVESKPGEGSTFYFSLPVEVAEVSHTGGGIGSVR